MKYMKFTISGRGNFPLDMLRYDCCYPSSPQDVSKIEGREPREITLIAANPFAPTKGRWASFGWTATNGEEVR